MNRHQVLTGAVNPGDRCFAVGYVEGVPFTAYASGCNIVILSSNFQRVQIIPGENQGNIQVGCIDCSTENGKIAASFANQVYIFEPTPQVPALKKSSHKLDYQWYKTGGFQTESLVSNLSWNHNGSRILTGSDSIQLWASVNDGGALQDRAKINSGLDPARPDRGSQWENIWTCTTATPVFHLLFSPDGQFFASAGKADRLVKIWYQTRKPSFKTGAPTDGETPKEDAYSFVYIAHPRAVTGFSWRRTSKYMTSGTVANILVTSCRDNICRLWSETLLPSSELMESSTNNLNVLNKRRDSRPHKRPTFSLGMKGSRKKRKSGGTSANLSTASTQESVEPNGHGGLPLHFHIAATINPNTDIPLLPAMGKMSRGNTPNFVVNWLNNKELQYTLAAETLLQINRDDKSESDPEDSSSEEESSSEDEGVVEGMNEGADERESEQTSPTVTGADEHDFGNSGSAQNGSVQSGTATPPEILTVDTNGLAGKPLMRPENLGSFPSVPQLASLAHVGSTPLARLQKKFDNLLREWNQSPDMLFSIHPIDGSFLLWLVDWVDETIPGVHRQPQVSFSCRIPQAFPVHDATTLCTNLVLYRSNLTMDPRAGRRQPNLLSPREERPGLTPSYSFSQRLGMVPPGVNIYAFTPKVSMLSKHSNGTLNQWEISFSENSKFQTVLNVAHNSRCCGHRFSLNDISCHPVLPLLLSASHHNIPKVEVDRKIVTSRTLRASSVGRKSSIISGDAADPANNIRRNSAINLFGRSLLSESEHHRLVSLSNSVADTDDLEMDMTEKDEVIIPDEMMEQLNQEMNWPDMSAPTGLCSELILWRVYPVGPLTKGGGVVELARINSPFLSAFSHVAWFPSLLPSSCLGALSNSPSACFVASDGYSLRVFQTVIDARSFLTEVLPGTDQFEGYLSSSSPIKKFIDAKTNDDCQQHKSSVISLQSTARPGCIIELDALQSAKQVWNNVQLMHIFPHQSVTDNSSVGPSLPCMPTDATRPYADRFYLVVLDRNPAGESIIHMWYLVVEAKILEVESVKEKEHIEEDIPDDSSVDSSDSEASHQFDSSGAPQATMKVRTYSRKVCTQKLTLPAGVDVVSATPSTSHLSSSTSYPAIMSTYMFSTACSDGKLRFWCCKVLDPGERRGSAEELKLELESLGSDASLTEDPCTVLTEDLLAEASYRWQEWKLMAQDSDPSSIVEVPGTPVSVSCAYTGRIGCVYRTDINPNSQVRRREPQAIPLQACIFECESSGGSEWVFEDKLDLGLLDLAPLNRETGSDIEDLNYKMMKRSSKVEDFINFKDLTASTSPAALDLTNVNLSPRAGRNRRMSPSFLGEKRELPVQMTWVSKEDGSHVLTVGMGMRVIIFAPVLPNRANVQLGPLQEKLLEQGLLANPGTQGAGATLLAKEDLRPKWLPLWTIALTSVDGISPLSKMLSWVRPGILVVGLQNEMHVYSQWKGPEQHLTSAKKKLGRREADSLKRPGMSAKESVISTVSNLSVDMLSLPMTKLDREQSYSELTRFAGIDQEDPALEVNEPEELTSDVGIFEYSYMACPVLPQYHPKQLMELLNCGKVRRVKAILAHLVRCFAGDSAIQRALLSGDNDSVNSLPEPENNFSTRPRSVSNSPVDQPSLDDTKLDYIELMSIPPLPLYALIAADKAESLPPPSTPSVTKANNLGSMPIGKESNAEYSTLFSYSVDNSASPTFDVFAEPTAGDRMSSVTMKMNDVTYFGIAQLRLLTNYLTHMHLPGLSSLDQMNLLALADTVASTKTEVTTHNTAGTGTAIGKDGAGYAHTTGTTSTHAGETLDECGLRFLLAMRFHVCLLRSLPPRQQVQLRHQGLATSHFAWAFHSEAEEELLSIIPGNQVGKPTWAELRAMGVGWWVRNDITLRRCIEKLAKVQFQANKNPLDAALFYLAMKKKTLVWGLFRSVSDVRMTQFFSNNFSQERWRKAALKNAFALLGRQRFEHAAAFFLLAGSLKDAIAVCLDNMEDIQLAMVIARLYEEDLEMPTAQKELLFQFVLGREKNGNLVEGSQPSKDPFLRSISHWMLKEYTQALETLIIPPARNKNDRQEVEADEEHWGNPDVFNFYNYLRTHPLLIRRQFAEQDKPAKGSSVLITGLTSGEEGDSVIKDEITNVERKLFFATAHAHSAAGCPMLTLEVLSKLPRVKSNGSSSKDCTEFKKDAEMSINNQGSSSDLITSGTIGSFKDSGVAPQPAKKGTDAVDWSQPLTNGKMELGLDLDWSQPIGSKFNDELQLEWSDDNSTDSDKENDNEKQTEPVPNHLQNGKNTEERTDSRKGSTDGETGTVDVFAQQLKFSSCLKIMMEELRTLATGFEVEGGQLRYQLYVWLEHEVEMLKELCSYGTSGILGMPEEVDQDGEQELENIDCVAERALHTRWIDLEEKRQRAARRKKWLKSHHHLLRTLMSYAIIYGLNGGGLTSVAIELLLLTQEIQQESLQRQLATPLPLPTTLPLLSASIAACKTVMTDPILYLRNFMHDILNAVLDLTAPPNHKRHMSAKVQTIHRNSMALSACIYQTLCDSDSFSGAESFTKATGMDAYDGRNTNVMYRSGNLVSVSRRKRHASCDGTLTVTSLPAKWPGVATLQALLTNERDEDSSTPNVFLCESLFAVYMSIIVHAMTSGNANELFRLAAHPLDTKMWSSVFGGGAKVLDQPKPTPSAATAPTSGDQTLTKQRNRYMLRLMGKASSGRLPASAEEEKPTPRDVFVPPETSIMDYFMIKPYVSPTQEGMDFDSDASDSSDDEDSDDDFSYRGDDLDPFAPKKRSKPSPGETEHSDFNSYSWCLMRYAFIKLILHKIQCFLPLSGIELAELPVASPKLHSILKLLEQWQQALMRKLDLFAGPPLDYIPGCNVDTPSAVGGPALLRYKGLLEPTNTPFRCKHRAALPTKRLWNYLVRQEVVQDIFISYIFKKKRCFDDAVDSVRGIPGFGTMPTSKVKLIHKEQEKIPAFCFNKANPTGVVVSTQRGLLELDISLLQNPQQTFWMEEEIDEHSTPRNRGNTLSHLEDDFLMVTPIERAMGPPPSVISSGYSNELNLSNQTGRGTNIITSRPLYHIRRLAAHPSLPYYLSGSNDGSVHMWEWGHTHKLYTHRFPGQYPKVTQMYFNDQGNKFGVADDSGKLSLWQVGMNSPTVTKPFWSKQCHNKALLDFNFLGSSSFLATAGLSSENKNICLWDTLMPMNKSMIHNFTCHDGGCPCLAYCPRQQILITGSKKGDVSIYDIRQRKLRHTFQAHDTGIKCLTVDPSEEYFVTGSAEGDIKVWCLSVHSLLHFYPGQHPRGNFFRQSGNGVLQLSILPSSHLYSCGGDGTMKWRALPEWDSIL
ncbi:dmX-like protein 2 isoform X2 [Patiria miniata]|uniref:RAVE complex protein Rav1 C-terminal domain-containing protein n=1 Tax=Patiria miniata TaxID=46514 RepID=A0A914BU50_PATMI|nr:dmX-like protein 2 isoform X2 [Patiria miniata]